MRENRLKNKLRRGESAIGTFVKLTDAAVPELLALAGFDFFVLDTEHVAVDREQLTNIVRAADAAGITPIVRVRENNQVEILQNLDLGCAGVQVPNVDSPEEARALVDSIPTVDAEPYYNSALRQLQEYYDAKLNTHRCEDLIELTMSLHRKKMKTLEQKRKFGAIDERYMKRAEDLLFGELAAALDIPKDGVRQYIGDRLTAKA